MKSVKLTKIEELENALHPHNISVGHVQTGPFIGEPVVGEAFMVGSFWGTSVVQELLPDNKFRTQNSIYQWEMSESKTENPQDPWIFEKDVLTAKEKGVHCLNWEDIYQEISKLTPEQRQMPVYVWGEEWGGRIRRIVKLLEITQDMINPSGDGLEPVYAYFDDKDFDIEEEDVVVAKGNLVLSNL